MKTQLYKACMYSGIITPLFGIIDGERVIFEDGSSTIKEGINTKISDSWEEAFNFLEVSLEVQLKETREKLAMLIDKQDQLYKSFKKQRNLNGIA